MMARWASAALPSSSRWESSRSTVRSRWSKTSWNSRSTNGEHPLLHRPFAHRISREDVVLEQLELIVDAVRGHEVAVHQFVENGVEDEARCCLRGACPLHALDGRLRIPRRTVGPRIADNDHPALAERDRDFAQVRRVGHDEAEAVEQLELRSLVPLDDVLDEQGMEVEPVGQDLHLGRVWRLGVDP
jgi:hypothetical protein